MTTPRPRYSAQEVAKAFVTKYYVILNKSPEVAHKFYQESSLLGWPGPDGVSKTVTTLSGIHGEIMSSDYKYCLFETETVEVQESLEGGILVAVTGLLALKDGVRKGFSQTFFLATQEDGFFVLNDILQVVDLSRFSTNTVIQDNQKKYQVAPAQNSGLVLSSSQTKKVVEKGNAKKTSASSVSKDPDANVAATTSSEVASSQTKEAVEDGNAEKTSDSSVSKDTDAKVAATNSSEVEASSEKACPILSPTSDVKKEASTKITYASMVAKASPTTSPLITSIHSKFDKKAVARLTFKASASFVQGASEVSNPRSTESNPSVHSNAAETEMQPVKRIYIGGLPYDITKQRLLEVLKQFGPVRRNSDSIQIRRQEDGFCCGFVEFESVDSARRAVEAHRVKFGRKESYMAYRRSASDRGKSMSYARESR
ncbi:nuclear transport factor 2-like [Henckelia pumila]|uniref:nuclear transport factor 2-like n=1 Tax=Henckelia pumila TaxID=405737 RepID=UPI003C6E8B1A